MIIYIFLFSFCIFLSLFIRQRQAEPGIVVSNVRKDRIRNLSLLTIIFFTLETFAGLRYQVGTDYWTYSNLHIPEVLAGITHRVEPLYRAVILLGIKFPIGGEQYQGIFILTHLLILIPIFITIYKMSEDYKWSIIVLLFSGYFNLSLSMMRQSIALSMALLSLNFIKNRKFVLFLICILIGFCFHKSVVFFLPFYFLYNKRINPNMSLLIIGILTILQRFFQPFLLKVVSTIGLYEHYFYTNRYGHGSDATYFFVFGTFFYAVYWLFDKRKKKFVVSLDEEKEWDFFGMISTILFFITCLFPIIPSAYRVFYSVFIFEIIEFPNILNLSFTKKYSTIIKISSIFVMLAFFYIVYVRFQSMDTIPYRTIFNKTNLRDYRFKVN